MSIDDLITLLLVILFVVVPLLRGVLGRLSGAGRSEAEGDEQGPARPADTRPGRRQMGGERADTGGASAGGDARGSGPEPASELQRRIEEARRRVREAQEGAGRAERREPEASRAPSAGPAAEEGRRAASAGGGGRQAPQAPQPPSGPRSPAPSGGFLGREGTAISTAGTAGGFLGREGISPSASVVRKSAPVPSLRRTRGRKGARLSRDRVVSLAGDDIVRGIVWHQILSEPKSARWRRRRKPSARRSP